MTSSRPQVSIIIRTKNEAQFVGQTLKAIFEQEILLPYEVIVIDSGSVDRTVEIVQKFNVRLYHIEARQFTFGYALNYGAALAHGEYLINLSAHCIPVHLKWMVTLLAPLLSDSSIVATYGKQIPIKGLNPFEERVLNVEFNPVNKGKVRAPFSNSNSAIRKEIWEKYPFDEKASFAEDFIWSQMLPPEYKLKYIPEAAVYHTHPLTFKYWAKRYYDAGLVQEYLEHVYGLKFPWAGPRYTGKYLIAKTIVRTARRYLYDSYHILNFLIVNGYWRYILVLPIYVILQLYYHNKGIKHGQKRYGSLQGKAR